MNCQREISRYLHFSHIIVVYVELFLFQVISLFWDMPLWKRRNANLVSWISWELFHLSGSNICRAQGRCLNMQFIGLTASSGALTSWGIMFFSNSISDLLLHCLFSESVWWWYWHNTTSTADYLWKPVSGWWELCGSFTRCMERSGTESLPLLSTLSKILLQVPQAKWRGKFILISY